MFINVEYPVQQKFRGGHAEQADTLEFSLCASIAPDRRPLSECAKRTSLGRRSGNRRRSARSTKFHSVSAVLYDRPGTSDLIWFYEANFYLIFMNSPAFFNTGRTAIYTTTTTMVPTIALTRVAPAAQVAMIFAAEDSTPRI